MVMVQVPTPASESSFRTQYTGREVDDLTQDYTEIKSDMCSFSMESCSNMLRKLRKCDDMDNCGLITNNLIVPGTKKSCATLSEMCRDKLDDTLQKLYDASALTQNEDVLQSFDEKINELSKLKHLINSVNASSNIVPVSSSKLGKKQEILPSDKARKTQAADAEFEKEEATV